MPIRFAAANAPGRAPAYSSIAKALAVRAIERVANDNGLSGQNNACAELFNDQMLRAALRHFAQHGLGAARVARAQAEKAFFEGDRQAYDWWLGITRTLDSRMATDTAKLPPHRA